MRPYDPSAPLIFLHVPKTAGTSLREIFRGWFGPGLLEHYAGVHDGSLPVRHDVSALVSAGIPLAIYGHFNRRRGFGVDDYYPEVRQFVTVLRDPFERTVSGYCHLVRQHQANPTRPAPSEGLRDYLRSKRDGAISFFPGFVTAENYEEMINRYFVEIGVVERLDVSLQRIANALGRSVANAELPRLNVNTEPVPEVADLREEFMANHPLDYQMYQYACERLDKSDAPRRNGSVSA
jgi:hypothetical protein